MREILKSLIRLFAEPATMEGIFGSFRVAGSAKSRLVPMFLLAFPIPLQAQNIDLLEYFIDTNTGFDSGQQIAVPSAANVEIMFNPDISALSSGHHVIYHRVQDTNGDWSPTMATPFFLEPGVDTQGDHEIEEMEVFYNSGNVPVGGSGTPIPVTTPGNEVTEQEILDLSNEDTGFNIAFIRVKGSSGIWGPRFPTRSSTT